MAKFSRANKIYKYYFSLLKKYGKPEGFWKKWCKNKKTRKDKEEIVLGAILTQRTSWKNVELAFTNLRKEKLLSIEKIYQVGGARKNLKLLEKLIRPSGFYRQKAKRLFELCRFITEERKSIKRFFKQELKICREQLLELPGIGQETADSILLYAGSKPIFVIDEYTRRFAEKHGLGNKFSYQGLQNLFQRNLPKNVKLYRDFHALIVLDGKNE